MTTYKIIYSYCGHASSICIDAESLEEAKEYLSDILYQTVSARRDKNRIYTSMKDLLSLYKIERIEEVKA